MATWKQLVTEQDTTNILSDVSAAGSADGQLLIYDNGNSYYTPATITAGTGISVTNSAAGITIASSVTDTDIDVNVTNLTARLPQITENVTIGDATDVTVTMAGDLTVTGDLIVSGTSTTLNTTTLEVEDVLIKLANVTTPTATTANGAGIQIESSATEADFPELKWSKDKGAGNTDGTDTGDGLTGWTVSNMHTSNHIDLPIAVMHFSTSIPGGTDYAGGKGSFWLDTDDQKLYIRTA